MKMLKFYALLIAVAAMVVVSCNVDVDGGSTSTSTTTTVLQTNTVYLTNTAFVSNTPYSSDFYECVVTYPTTNDFLTNFISNATFYSPVTNVNSNNEITLTNYSTNTVETSGQAGGILTFTNECFITNSEYVSNVIDADVEVTVNNLCPKVTASDAAASEYYGINNANSASSFDGKAFLVGTSYDETSTGAIYLNEWNGVTGVFDETKITASDGGTFQSFGCSVAISSNAEALVAGAYTFSSSRGKAYVYRWNGASYDEVILTASDGGADDYFGVSVAVNNDGSTVVVGANEDDIVGTDSGSVYIYKWNGSSYDETKLTNTDSSDGDYFGISVDVSDDGETVVVGSHRIDANVGAVYIFEWNGTGWDETKINESSSYYGYSVSVTPDGENILVGAIEENSARGAAYLYQWNGTDYDMTHILASDGAVSDQFGHSVSISADGNTLLVGARNDDSSTGKVYVYQWDGSAWVETMRTAPDKAINDYFGYSVSVSGDGNTALVCSPYDDDDGSNSGSVYLFTDF